MPWLVGNCVAVIRLIWRLRRGYLVGSDRSDELRRSGDFTTDFHGFFLISHRFHRFHRFFVAVIIVWGDFICEICEICVR